MDFEKIYAQFQEWVQSLAEKSDITIDPHYLDELQAGESGTQAVMPLTVHFTKGETFRGEVKMDSSSMETYTLQLYALAHTGVITPNPGVTTNQVMDMSPGSFDEKARDFLPPTGFPPGPLQFCVELVQMVKALPPEVKVRSDFGYDNERNAMSLKLGMIWPQADSTILNLNVWIEYRAVY